MVHGPLADPPAVKAVLVRLDGTEVALATSAGRLVSDSDGFQRVVARITPAGVGSGEYRCASRSRMRAAAQSGPTSGCACSSHASTRVECPRRNWVRTQLRRRDTRALTP